MLSIQGDLPEHVHELNAGWAEHGLDEYISLKETIKSLRDMQGDIIADCIKYANEPTYAEAMAKTATRRQWLKERRGKPMNREEAVAKTEEWERRFSK